MRITFSTDRPAGRQGRAPHVAVLVENVSLADDNRLQKEVHDLVEAGYQVSVITRRDPANAPFRDVVGLQLVEYPPPPEGASTLGHLSEYLVSLGWQSAALAKLFRRGRVDVLQLCQPPDIYFPFARLVRWRGTRVVVDQRDLMAETLKQRYETVPAVLLKAVHWLEAQTQRNCDHTLVTNTYLRKRLMESGGAGERISLVYNGPVIGRVRAAVPDPAMRGSHRQLVCWAGKMGKQDRVDQVLRVAAILVHDLGYRDCGFALIGNGECLEELKALTVELGLEPWVRFLGWMPEVDLYSALASCDVGIDTSLQEEVTPVKALEYLAVGIPLLCFDLEQVRQVANGAGVFVPPGDVRAMAQALVDLLADHEGRERLGRTGRQRIVDQLAWEHQSRTYLAVIDRQLDATPFSWSPEDASAATAAAAEARHRS
jgi:glycosyltransferase involved in cell wall biosynthesis